MAYALSRTDPRDRPTGASRVAQWIRRRLTAGWIGAELLLIVAVPCFITVPWSTHLYDQQRLGSAVAPPPRAPSLGEPMGSDDLGRSMLWRCLMGGTISLGMGISAAVISVTIGVGWGATAGYFGGRTDALMMRAVDVLYGLPYILLVVLGDMALSPLFRSGADLVFGSHQGVAAGVTDVLTLMVAIGGVAWLTMARVIRGQVLSLRAQPFIEAARACGVGPWRIMTRHLLPNLAGPIIVYATLTVPAAILQESFLSFLGIGVQPPLPSWGNLASDGVGQLPALVTRGVAMPWWMLVFPCLLLGLTLLGLNFLGDALRERFDPSGRKT